MTTHPTTKSSHATFEPTTWEEARAEVDALRRENERLRQAYASLAQVHEEVTERLQKLSFECLRMRRQIFGRKTHNIPDESEILPFDFKTDGTVANEDDPPISEDILRGFLQPPPDSDEPNKPHENGYVPKRDASSAIDVDAVDNSNDKPDTSSSKPVVSEASHPDLEPAPNRPPDAPSITKELDPTREAVGQPKKVPPKKKANGRSRHGRAPIPEGLPKKTVTLEPPERLAPGGEKLVRIGIETSRKLSIIPAMVCEMEIIRPKYIDPNQVEAVDEARKANEQAVTTMSESEIEAADKIPAPTVRVYKAELPDHPIDRCKATVALISFIIVTKYFDFVPLYHQQMYTFERWGLKVARSTMCGWVKGACGYLKAIYDAMRTIVIERSEVLHLDATTILVQRNGHYVRQYVWGMVSDLGHHLYVDTEKHNGDTVKVLLKGFLGNLVTDASAVFGPFLRENPSVCNGRCWSHVRSKFIDAFFENPDVARYAISLINQLFVIEAATLALPVQERECVRRQQAWPVVVEIFRWMPEQAERLGQTPLGKAMRYAVRNNIALTRFRFDGRISIHNNVAERILRRIAKGRDNWLFFGSNDGAEWNSIIMSLLASCRLHDIEPWAYLQDVLLLLPNWKKAEALDLAPAHWKETRQRPEVRAFLDQHPLRCVLPAELPPSTMPPKRMSPKADGLERAA